jgi:caa(3)-type oxidase subunit IV
MKHAEVQSPDPAHAHAADHAGHHPNYVKIYWVLLALLAVSVMGPMLGHPTLTLITAFGIALVKAYLVAANFMHLKFERRYVAYLLVTVLAIMGLFYAGVSPDVMHHSGTQWENVAAQEWSKQAVIKAREAHEHPHGHEPGGESHEGGHTEAH